MGMRATLRENIASLATCQKEIYALLALQVRRCVRVPMGVGEPRAHAQGRAHNLLMSSPPPFMHDTSLRPTDVRGPL